MLPLLALLASPAHALDLTLQFQGDDTRPATVRDRALDNPVIVPLSDSRGDAWLMTVTLVEETQQTARIKGRARLVDVPDASLERAFESVVRIGQEATLEVQDPDGESWTVALRATPGQDAPIVDCELLVTPTVDQLAEALQSFVDAGIEPRTGNGLFQIGDARTEAHWVCGW